MKVEVKKVYNVEKCSQCPHLGEYIDTSVCEDSFDEPNYEWYCDHPEMPRILSGYREGHGRLIDVGMSKFQKCDIIPDWCPEQKKEETPRSMTFGSAWELDS
jgi:hypothetical protein